MAAESGSTKTLGTAVRALIDAGDGERLAALVATDPRAATVEVRWGEDIHAADPQRHEPPNRCSALHYVAQARFHGAREEGNPVTLARVLLDSGADADHGGRGPAGETVLQTAVSLYERDLAELLIERGATVDALGGCVDNGSALALAAHFGATAEVDLLVAHGARVHNLALAAAVGDVAPFMTPEGALAVDAGARHPDDRDPTPLFADRASLLQRALTYAAVHARAAALDALLSAGAELDGFDQGGTALHWCAWWRKGEGSALLLARGANADVTDPTHGATPAQWAAYRAGG